jgi:hypothetical protein
MYLTFKFAALRPGETAHFSFVYLSKDSLESSALDSVSGAVMAQPTDMVSGTVALFSAVASRHAILGCAFSVFAVKSAVSPSSAWYPLGSVGYAESSNVSICNITSSAAVFSSGSAQVSVSMTTAGGSYSATRAIVISNAATSYCFSTAGGGGSFVFEPDLLSSLGVSRCAGSSSASRVSFYREYFAKDEMVSQLIEAVLTAPYSVSVNVSDLEAGTTIYVKAVAQLTTAEETVSVFTGTVGSWPRPTESPSSAPSVSPVSVSMGSYCDSSAESGPADCSSGDVYLAGAPWVGDRVGSLV